MKTLFTGSGNISYRHIRNLRSLYPDTTIILWRRETNPNNTSDKHKGFVDRIVYNLEEVLDERPDVAFVTCPAATHIDKAIKLADAGIHIFMEKPLSHSLDGVQTLTDIANLKRLTLMVGYNFRFFEPLKKLKSLIESGLIGTPNYVRAEAGQYLPDWRPDADYKLSASARRELGGGVVFELSHEIDYLTWIFGPIFRVAAKIDHLSDLDIDVEDTAEILISFQNEKLIGSVHLNMTQRPKHRSCKIIGTNGMLELNHSTQRLSFWPRTSGSSEEILRWDDCEYDQMYVDEVIHFFDCVRNRRVPESDVGQAARTLKVLLAVKLSSANNQFVEI